MADPITVGTTGLVSSICGGILAIFGIKKQIAKDIQGCFKPELEKLDARIQRLEGVDILTIPSHDKICNSNHKVLELELQNLREKMGSNQDLIIEKINNIDSKITDCPGRDGT